MFVLMGVMRTVSCLVSRGSFLSARVNFEILALVELIEEDDEQCRMEVFPIL